MNWAELIGLVIGVCFVGLSLWAIDKTRGKTWGDLFKS